MDLDLDVIPDDLKDGYGGNYGDHNSMRPLLRRLPSPSPTMSGKRARQPWWRSPRTTAVAPPTTKIAPTASRSGHTRLEWIEYFVAKHLDEKIKYATISDKFSTREN